MEFLIDREDIAGPVNLAAPHPLPQRAFVRTLRSAWGVPVSLPATKWMAEVGAFALRSDTELLLDFVEAEFTEDIYMTDLGLTWLAYHSPPAGRSWKRQLAASPAD